MTIQDNPQPAQQAATPDLTIIAQDAAKAAGMVAVRTMGAKEIGDLFRRNLWPSSSNMYLEAFLHVMRELGINSEPTQAERLHERFPHISVADIEALLGEAGK